MAVICLVLVLLISPIFFNYTVTSREPIQIDGIFSEWKRIPSFSDSLTDQIQNKDVNIQEFKVTINDWGELAFFMQMEGTILNGTHGMDSVNIFIDEDNLRSSGYHIKSIGADKMIAVTGWENKVFASGYSEFNNSRSAFDLNGFDRFFNIPAAVIDSRMETKIWLSQLNTNPEYPIKVIFSSRDTAGNQDISDIIVSHMEGALLINETSVAPMEIPKGTEKEPITRFNMSAQGADITLSSLNLTFTGTATSSEIRELFIYLDSNENGDFDLLSDEEIVRSPRGFDQGRVSLLFDQIIPKDTTKTYFAVLDISSSARDERTIGIRIQDPLDVLFDPGVVTISPLYLTNSYIGSVGDNITIDGAFGDWKNATFKIDAFQDVMIEKENVFNPNIDIIKYGVTNNTQLLSIYMDVSGTMLGGVSIPWNGSRPKDIITPFLDSDGDGIPDEQEPFEHINDFDDDAGEPDNPNNTWLDTGNDFEDHDSDNDGIEDYPWGNDTKLVRLDTNATKYIGPPPPIPPTPEVNGEDITYIFIDSDNNATTGYFVNPDIGAEYMVNISGKGNTILSKKLNVFNSTFNNEWIWEYITSVDAAVDSKAMEAQIDFDLLGIGQNQSYNIWFLTTDWRDANDMSNEPINNTRGARGTRAKPPGAGSKVKLNEVFPDSNGWIELYNTGNKNEDISDWVIEWDSTTYTIPTGTTLSPGGWLAFDVGSISASGTAILYNDAGQERDTTTYSSVPSGQGWGRYPDGESNWIFTNPTKAAANTPATPPPSVNIVINEVYPDINGWVELYNLETQGGPTDISGWYIIWSGGNYTLPPNTKIQKQSFLAFDVGNIPDSDTVYLYNDVGAEQDSTSFSNITVGYGWGRYTDGSGNWWTTIPTKAAANMIPEFSDAIFPFMFTLFIFGLVQHRKKKEKKVKDMKNANRKLPNISQNPVDSRMLTETVEELLSLSDVNGAAIFKGSDQILSWHSHEDINANLYVDFIKGYITDNPPDMKSGYESGLFSQQIIDFNGSRILISGIGADVTFLLFVDKNAYLGLTMLEMEGCIRRIDKILKMRNT
jgi:predicted regulator of Ras-like GTPase activity (Roadblock/LC7/MglB family)